MNHISALLSDHLQARFPDARGIEVSGVDLVLLDADITGIATTYIKSKGRLSPCKLQLIKDCQDDIQRVISKLNGYNKDYFKRLEEMTRITSS